MPKKKAGVTHVCVVLDESGSMAACRQATISGFNEYMGDLKKQGGALDVSLTKFNTDFNVVYTATPLKDVPDLTGQTYQPGGMTALYDAIAHCVRGIEKRVGTGDRALVVILTDGEENRSKEHTRQQIADLIKTKEGEGNWTFAYIGANQDAWAVSSSIGVQHGNTSSYVPTPAGTSVAFRSVSQGTIAYATQDSAQSAAFFDPPAAKKRKTPA